MHACPTQVCTGLCLLVDSLQLIQASSGSRRGAAAGWASGSAAGGRLGPDVDADGRMHGHVLPHGAAVLRQMAAR